MALVKRKKTILEHDPEAKKGKKKRITRVSGAPADPEGNQVRGKGKRREGPAAERGAASLGEESSLQRRSQGNGKKRTKLPPASSQAEEALLRETPSRKRSKKRKTTSRGSCATAEETSEAEEQSAKRKKKRHTKKLDPNPKEEDAQSDSNDSFFHGDASAGVQEPKVKVMERAWRDDGKLIHDYKVWVGNLPRTVSDEAVLADFAMYGQILKLDMPRSKNGVLDGVAFIYFATEEGMNKALALDGKDYNGNRLRVNRATPQRRAKEKDAGSQGPATSDCTVFVGGLPHDINEDELRNTFGSCGEIENIRLPRGEDGKPRGFAFIVFSQLKAVRKALLQDGSECKGRTIKVAKHSANALQSGDGKSQTQTQGGTESAKTVFVGSLPPDTSLEKLKTDFAECGPVEKVRLVQDSNGHFKGAAFVVFKNVAAAKKAMDWNGQFFYGSRAIKVAPARQRNEKPA